MRVGGRSVLVFVVFVQRGVETKHRYEYVRAGFEKCRDHGLLQLSVAAVAYLPPRSPEVLKIYS